jgi:regulator of sigma E protease
VTGLILAILMLSTLIVAHELGHLILAKVLGVKVESFAVGFGPALLRRRIGETEYRVGAILLGGYNRLLGEKPGEPVPEGEKAKAFSEQAIWKRALIVLAGSVFNIIFAVLLLFCLYLWGVAVPGVRVGEVLKGGPAEAAGVRQGDLIMAVNGVAVGTWNEVLREIDLAAGTKAVFEVDREEGPLAFEIDVEKRTMVDALRRKLVVGFIGIRNDGERVIVKRGLADASLAASKKAADMVGVVFIAMYQLARGEVPISELAGPAMIVKTVSEQLALSVQNVVLVLAFISINLGVFNLLPIPALDGGHFPFLIVEWVRGRPVSPRVMLNVQRTGIVLIMSLLAIVVYNDLQKFFK